jgi:Uma2 family endonuclease
MGTDIIEQKGEVSNQLQECRTVMKLAKTLTAITVDEYLRDEASDRTKHEYVDGRVFAMAGGSRTHNKIAGNIFAALRSHVLKNPCEAYISDVKVWIKSSKSFYYPDVLVACDRHDAKSVFTEAPVLIVEVLSRSTASIDRREKVVAYRQIPTLWQYLIVHQVRQRVELHQKDVSNEWQVTVLEIGSLQLLDSTPAGAIELNLADVYEDVEFKTRRVREDASPYTTEGGIDDEESDDDLYDDDEEDVKDY